MEEKIISLHSRGMSTRDIYDQIKDLYGIEVSAENEAERSKQQMGQAVSLCYKELES